MHQEVGSIAAHADLVVEFVNFHRENDGGSDVVSREVYDRLCLCRHCYAC